MLGDDRFGEKHRAPVRRIKAIEQGGKLANEIRVRHTRREHFVKPAVAAEKFARFGCDVLKRANVIRQRTPPAEDSAEVPCLLCTSDAADE